MAILLHDGLTRTYPTSICHVLPYGTTRLVGVGAFLGSLRGLKLFRQPSVISSRPPAGNAHRWAFHF